MSLVVLASEGVFSAQLFRRLALGVAPVMVVVPPETRAARIHRLVLLGPQAAFAELCANDIGGDSLLGGRCAGCNPRWRLMWFLCGN